MPDYISSVAFDSLSETVVNVVFLDEDGFEVSISGIPTWKVVNSKIATVIPSDDGLSAIIRLTGVIGNTSIIVTADSGFDEYGMIPVEVILNVESLPIRQITAHLTQYTLRDRSG